MVTLKTDNRSRVKLPGVKPGVVFAYETTGEVVKLTPVRPAESADHPAKFKLVKRDGFTVIETDRVVNLETIEELLSELP